MSSQRRSMASSPARVWYWKGVVGVGVGVGRGVSMPLVFLPVGTPYNLVRGSVEHRRPGLAAPPSSSSEEEAASCSGLSMAWIRTAAAAAADRARGLGHRLQTDPMGDRL